VKVCPGWAGCEVILISIPGMGVSPMSDHFVEILIAVHRAADVVGEGWGAGHQKGRE